LKTLINLAIFFKFNPPLRRMVNLNGISPLTQWKHCHSRQTNVNTWVDGYGCCEWYSYTNASDTLTFAITMGQHVGWRLRLLRMLFCPTNLVYHHGTLNVIPRPTPLFPPRRIQPTSLAV